MAGESVMELHRYFRLSTRWSASGWIEPLNCGGRLSWVELLAYTKAHGWAGRVPAMSMTRAAREWNIPEVDVSAMIAAATLDGALAIEGSEWVVNNWPKYQDDNTNAIRQRRYREAKSQLNNERDVTDSNVTRRYVTQVTEEKTREDKTRKDKPPVVPLSGANPKRKAGQQLPNEWQPNAAHGEIATRLGLDCNAEAEKFRDHAEAKGRVLKSWDAGFRMWLKNAQRFDSPRGNGKSNGSLPVNIDPISGKPFQEYQLNTAGTEMWRHGKWVPAKR